MGLIQVLKKFTTRVVQIQAARIPAQTADHPSSTSDTSGIALFMVISSVAILALLVTEFVYIAQINQAIAFGSLDQMKAHYLAKSGLKLSLLRIKAFTQVKAMASKMGGALPGGGSVIPQKLLQQVWAFPFMYPLPTTLPGMNAADKDAIEKFQKTSGLEGKYTALIESESNKFNLNSLLASYAASSSTTPGSAPTQPPPGGGSPPGANQTPPGGPPNPTPSPSASFNPQTARESLAAYLGSIYTQKLESEPDYASYHDDFRLEDFVDQISGWVDRAYESTSTGSHTDIVMKKAPFYSPTELHMLPAIDDDLYSLFIPQLTSRLSSSININTMNEGLLRSIATNMSPAEAKAFFTYRDSDEDDNQFKSSDDFFTYLSKNVAAFNNPQAITNLKANLASRSLVLVTDESEFKITISAQVGQSTKTIVAWVSIGSAPPPAPGTSIAQRPPTTPPPVGTPGAANGMAALNDPGLRITYMRIF